MVKPNANKLPMRPAEKPQIRGRLSRMPEGPGDYRPDSELRDSYAKSMDKRAIEKEAMAGAIQSPRSFGMKRSAKKSGKFKGFKI